MDLIEKENMIEVKKIRIELLKEVSSTKIAKLISLHIVDICSNVQVEEWVKPIERNKKRI